MATKPCRRRERGRPQTSLREDPDRVVGTYQRYDFQDERRVALDRSGRRVEALATGTEENVVKLAAARR
jgi:hypothetical protein